MLVGADMPTEVKSEEEEAKSQLFNAIVLQDFHKAENILHQNPGLLPPVQQIQVESMLQRVQDYGLTNMEGVRAANDLRVALANSL